MAGSNIQQLLRNAVKLMGREELAAALKVPEHLLDAWMNGHASMPERKLRMLADILDDLSGHKP